MNEWTDVANRNDSFFGLLVFDFLPGYGASFFLCLLLFFLGCLYCWFSCFIFLMDMFLGSFLCEFLNYPSWRYFCSLSYLSSLNCSYVFFSLHCPGYLYLFIGGWVYVNGLRDLQIAISCSLTPFNLRIMCFSRNRPTRWRCFIWNLQRSMYSVSGWNCGTWTDYSLSLLFVGVLAVPCTYAHMMNVLGAGCFHANLSMAGRRLQSDSSDSGFPCLYGLLYPFVQTMYEFWWPVILTFFYSFSLSFNWIFKFWIWIWNGAVRFGFWILPIDHTFEFCWPSCGLLDHLLFSFALVRYFRSVMDCPSFN